MCKPGQPCPGMGEADDMEVVKLAKKMADHLSTAITPVLHEAFGTFGLDKALANKADRATVSVLALTKLGASVVANAAVNIVMNARIDQVETAIEEGFTKLTSFAESELRDYVLRGFITAAEMRGVMEDAKREAAEAGITDPKARGEFIAKRVAESRSAKGVYTRFDVDTPEGREEVEVSNG